MLSTKTKNYESNSIKSDSLKFFEMLSDLSLDNNISNNFINTVNKINGNYSIAFTFKQYDQVLISSNCGSLFYFYEHLYDMFHIALLNLLFHVILNEVYHHKIFYQTNYIEN